MRPINKDVYLVQHKGLIPLGLTDEHKDFKIETSRGWYPSSNYSWILRDSIANKTSLALDHTRYCNSGGTTYIYRGGLIVDARSTHILTLPVINHLGNKMLLVNDTFDTPKCQQRWRAMRTHFRKAMHMIVEDKPNLKMVKVPHSFLQKFKIQYNYVPSRTAVINLHTRIIRDTIDESI